MTTATLAAPSPSSASTTTDVVRVTNLEKRYGATRILHGITFSVHAGELFGLLGTNGAGKTTTVEILQGLRRADSGSVEVLGLDPARSGDRLRRSIGAQLQDAALPDRMRVGEALRLFASLHPSPRPLDELADEWDLNDLQHRPFSALSGGERQRLFVALALIGQPKLVFLDELTQNLDPVSRRNTWDVVRRVRNAGTTVVLVTHDVEEAERLCDRIVILHDGSIVADGAPANIVASLGPTATVTFTDPELDLRVIRGLPGAKRVTRDGATVSVEGTGPLLAHVGARLVALDRPPLDLTVQRPTLEDHFVALTQDATS